MIDDFRAIYFPYCIEKQQDGSWIVLNRNYKPLGFNTKNFITYEDYPVSIKLTKLTKEKLAEISYNGEVKGNRVYLYDDFCVPIDDKKYMDIYLEKLKILIKLN